MSRFSDLFQEPISSPEPTSELENVEEVVDVKTEKVIKSPKKKSKMRK